MAINSFPHVRFYSGINASTLKKKYRDLDRKKPKINDDEVMTHMVMGSAIVDGRLELDRCKLIAIDKNFAEKNQVLFLRPRDLLLKCSVPYDAALVGDEIDSAYKVVVPNYAIIARCNEGYNREFLWAFFNSGAYRRQFAEVADGSKLPMVTIKRLEKIRIPDYDLAQQEKIGQYFSNVLEQKRLIDGWINAQMDNMDHLFEAGKGGAV